MLVSSLHIHFIIFIQEEDCKFFQVNAVNHDSRNLRIKKEKKKRIVYIIGYKPEALQTVTITSDHVLGNL